MNTEITDNTNSGWIFYDGECSLCRTWAGRLRGALQRRGFLLLPLQTPWVRASLRLDNRSPLKEMLVQLPDGRTFGGAEAVVELARRIWWMWPLWAASRIPGMLRALRVGYNFLAANRHCSSDACVIAPNWRWLDWLPVIVLPLASISSRDALADWVFMWFLALAIFFGCKWLTWRRACAVGPGPTFVRSFVYFFAWPGMDGTEFLLPYLSNGGGRRETPNQVVPPKNRVLTPAPSRTSWVFALSKALLGASLLGLVTKATSATPPLLSGWLSMTGIVLLLHFGLFHLLALTWQRAGIVARPVMQSPLLATSLGDFWGKRWNTAFSALARDLVFRPLARRGGIRRATVGVFLISGLIHDLVISLPAGGGFGLPTSYFLLQGVAVLFERSRAGCALGLGRGRRGWLFVLLVTAGPAFWLFHPLFIRNVILPMVQALGASWNAL